MHRKTWSRTSGKVIVDRVIILLVYTLTLTSLNAYMREGSAYPMSGVLLKTPLQTRMM